MTRFRSCCKQRETKKTKKVSKRTIPLHWTVLDQNVCKGECNFQSARTWVLLFLSSAAILRKTAGEEQARNPRQQEQLQKLPKQKA